MNSRQALLTAVQILAVLTANDGAGSEFDADLLDGQHGAYYRDADNIDAGTLATARGGTGVSNVSGSLAFDGVTTISGGGTVSLGGYTLTVPATGTVALLAAGNAFTGANTFVNASGIVTRQGSGQDGVVLLGRAGGASSYSATITPTTLTASRTHTLQDASGTLALLSGTQSWSGTQSFPDNVLRIVGSSDATKIAVFEVDGFTTATTRTLTLPNANTTLAGLSVIQTFTAAVTFSDATGVTISATTGNTLNVSSTNSSATLASNSIYTAGGIGAEGNVSIAGTFRSVSAATTGQPQFVLATTSGGDSIVLRYSEDAVSSIPADYWYLRLGGNTARPFAITSFDASLLLTLSAAGALALPATTGTTLTVSSTATNAITCSGGATFGNGAVVSRSTSTTANSLSISLLKTASTGSAVYNGVSASFTDSSTDTASYFSSAYRGILDITGSGTNSGYDRGFTFEAYHRGNGTRSVVTAAYLEAGTYNGGSDSTGTITALRGLQIRALKTTSSTITTSVLIDLEANVGTTQFALRTASTSGIVSIGDTSSSALTCAGGIVSIGATQGIGYAIGAGGTVTQATSKATGVTLSKVCGTITLNNAALAANTSVQFTWTNTAIAAGDKIVIDHDSVGTLGAYRIIATPGAGSATVTIYNATGGSLSEAIVLRFVIIKAVTA